MRYLTKVEQEVVDMLIADADDMISQLTTVLAPEEPAVAEVMAARSWLSAIRKTGKVNVP